MYNQSASSPISCRQCGYSMSPSHSTISPHRSRSSTPWMTTEEAAQYLKVKRRTLLLLVRQGKVKAYPALGIRRRVWRFRREDLDAYLLGASVVTSNTPAVLKERRISETSTETKGSS